MFELPRRCFGAKIRKIGMTLHTPDLLNKSGVQGDIHFMFDFVVNNINMYRVFDICHSLQTHFIHRKLCTDNGHDILLYA